MSALGCGSQRGQDQWPVFGRMTSDRGLCRPLARFRHGGRRPRAGHSTISGIEVHPFSPSAGAQPILKAHRGRIGVLERPQSLACADGHRRCDNCVARHVVGSPWSEVRAVHRFLQITGCCGGTGSGAQAVAASQVHGPRALSFATTSGRDAIVGWLIAGRPIRSAGCRLRPARRMSHRRCRRGHRLRRAGRWCVHLRRSHRWAALTRASRRSGAPGGGEGFAHVDRYGSSAHLLTWCFVSESGEVGCGVYQAGRLEHLRY